MLPWVKQVINNNSRTTQIAEIWTCAQGFYVARYFWLEYNKAKTFIDVKKKKLPSSRFFKTENISCPLQHCGNNPEWRNSDANGLAQADYLLSKHTNKYSLRCMT